MSNKASSRFFTLCITDIIDRGVSLAEAEIRLDLFIAAFSLYEVGDAEVCRSLHNILAPCMDELSVSPLPGAKVLLKLLQSAKV
ncbi:unnamed protein product [Echinostoma caproni]|uniref:Uncharacterized protein n=1 Tax=Echinostoma caproni TaxID=27848 RepID=A0A183ALI4_9TREM|nr:unnamed protein product [Echinostoma caproni]